MSQNNTTIIIHAGIDVAKASLQLHLGGALHALDNTPAAHRRLLRMLAATEAKAPPGARVRVVIEATGGYEAGLVAALHAANRLVSVIPPSRARHFAHARAGHAKTDPIAAAVLTAFGEAIAPEPTPPASPAQRKLATLVGRRAQLVDTRVAEVNRAAHYSEKLLRAQSRTLLALLDRQIAACERAIAAQIAADEQIKARAQRVQQVSGIGAVTAEEEGNSGGWWTGEPAVLQAHMPELGALRDAGAASLAALAPYNRDSGPHQGVRYIRGGRATVRCALFMASLSAIRHDPILRAFYGCLRAAAKLKMVALTAVMRKLLILLNRLLKNPDFKLQAAS